MNQENGQSQELEFQPVTFDATELPPEAAPGSYDATANKVKVTKTTKDGYPMMIVEWTLDAADTGSENSVGAEIADFLTFFPQGHKAYRMCVSRVRGLLDALHIDPEVLPKELNSKADFDGIVDAIQGQSLRVYITLQTDKRNGGQRATVGYTAPKGSAADEEEDAPAPRGKTAPAKKPLNGKTNGNGKKR